ncbi:MAG: peptide-methionine (S)-S-oxide reductase MsrA [Alphaproteobacteria bacterium]|jgi:peptide-methionine (S)-S-oxide reductase|nr:peptide-methionine (S)-S-oxide reductase MsrA [Alphaproteobacteria bacterium]
MAIATFGAGCFWGVEMAFRGLGGVTATVVGYTGGQTPNPCYPEVCTGATGHAEVVRVDYDPAQISYETLLETFWACHDATQENRQGPDVGTQYRSLILTHDEDQARAAAAAKAALVAAGVPVATGIEVVGDFWLAEDYHQQYLEKLGIRHG